MVANVGWRLFFRFEYAGLEDLHEVIPAFLLSLVTYIIVSLMTKSRVPDKGHLDLVFNGTAPKILPAGYSALGHFR
jgi:Na+/proline symporter